ncbi:MAG TPA: efflux RND transporter periplasmic adaptor subunit [Gammaproteobacteria bacterium]|nr:efflux RND transporter periplasmic adaptor subunit [Gammaproteobacteria bacterium]
MNSSGKIVGAIVAIVVASGIGWYVGQSSAPMNQESAVEHGIKHQDSKYQCPMHPHIIKDQEGSCPICAMKLVPVKQEKTAAKKEKKILYWVAPMDPNYRRDKPGKSPMGMDLEPVYSEGDDDESSDEKGPVVKISPAVENHLGVRTAMVKSGKLWRRINTVGYVGHDESRVSHIHLRVDGWIERLAVDIEGDRVKKGQRLFDLYSPKLVNAMEEYVQALRSKNQRLSTAAREKLISLGISNRQVKKLLKTRKVPQTISVYSPQDGIVSLLKVREGMYVKPMNEVMSLADLSSVWVLAEVFESQSEWVLLGQQADVTLSYIPGRTWEGEVDYVYPSLDAKNRTLIVRLRFDNPGEMLKPNMYANVSIYGGAKQNVLSVPREALIRSGGTERLIIAKGHGRFAQRVVVAGMESGDYVEIRSGVSAGETVVTSSQFLIDSEASMKASIARMTDPQSSEQSSAEPEGGSADMGMSAKGKGVITGLMIDHGMITLQHEAIEALGWPEMTMDFTTEEGVSLQGLSKGDVVEFELLKSADKYLISAISRQGE